jgi:ABC-type lipopolysaccharide export system ATPase subunit
VVGLTLPDSGRVFIDDEELSGLPMHLPLAVALAEPFSAQETVIIVCWRHAFCHFFWGHRPI